MFFRISFPIEPPNGLINPLCDRRGKQLLQLVFARQRRRGRARKRGKPAAERKLMMPAIDGARQLADLPFRMNPVPQSVEP